MSVNPFSFYPTVTPVRLSSPNNLAGFYFNGPLNNGIGSSLTSTSFSNLVLDGINVNFGDRIFLFNQSNLNENGIYVVDNIGSNDTNWKLVRSDDFRSLEQLKSGQFFSVGAGNTLSGNIFVLIEPLPFQVGLGDINFKNVTGNSGGGPFLTVAGNLSDVNNVNESYINLGFGQPFLTLSDSDFIGGFYTITNPPPTNINLVVDNPGNTLILPNNFNVIGSLTEGQSIYIQSNGTATVHLQNSDGSQHLVDIQTNQYYRLLLINDSGPGFWINQPYVLSINGMNGFVNIPIVVESWNGSTTPVNVTGGSGVDITDGIISLTGTGASIGYGFYLGNQPLTPALSFTDTLTWKLVSAPLLLDSNSSNVVVGTDSFGTFLQNSSSSLNVFSFISNLYMCRNTNATANGYYLTLFYSANGVSAPVIYGSGSDIVPFGLRTINSSPGDTSGIVSFCYSAIITMDPNSKIYLAIRNNGSVTPANNDINIFTGSFVISKVGDVGALTSGVSSLNGLTGNIDLINTDGSVSITSGGLDVNISVNQFTIVSGTSQSLSQNNSYLCTNGALTTLPLPTVCNIGSFIKVAGLGSGLFTISQSTGQSISMGTRITTTGSSGNLSSDDINSSIELVCTVANTSFMVINSQGNFTLL